ncbi:MAG: mobile mystery protein A [Planctomycetota bacterium]|jgi:predicted DNA-binding mobile mystery protein A
MRSKYKKLAAKQLDETLQRIGMLGDIAIPVKGWVRAIRDALGMSARQLAERMKVNQQRIARIEQDEKGGRVTLNTLQNAAEAMDCVFVYGFVPKTSLDQIVRRQARRVALKRMERSNQMMRLEQQELTEAEKADLLNEMIDEILSTMPRNLWDE